MTGGRETTDTAVIKNDGFRVDGFDHLECLPVAAGAEFTAVLEIMEPQRLISGILPGKRHMVKGVKGILFGIGDIFAQVLPESFNTSGAVTCQMGAVVKVESIQFDRFETEFDQFRVIFIVVQ